MENEILSLFDENTAKNFFTLSTEDAIKIKKNFARFLAVYYLDLPLICCQNEKQKLPDLFSWSQKTEKEFQTDGFKVFDRQFITSILPANYSPKSVIFLFLQVDAVLEAVLYTDHFNDYRTILLLRYYADTIYETNLFTDSCLEIVDNVCQLISEYKNTNSRNQDILTAIDSRIQSIIQLDIIFDTDLIHILRNKIIEELEFLFYCLPTTVPDHVSLPRPPLYALLAKYADDENQEFIIWNKMHLFVHSYLLLLQKTNWLKTVINKLTKFINQNENIESFVVEEDNGFLDKFISIIIIILKMSYRDILSLAKREEWDAIDLINENYYSLFPNHETETNQEIFQRFLKIASEADLEQILIMLHGFREQFHQTNEFLPSLTDETKDEWQKYYLTTSIDNSQPSNDDFITWLMPKQMILNIHEFKKLEFFSNRWKSFLINDKQLIPICLGLTVNEIFKIESTTILQQLSVNTSMTMENIIQKQEIKSTESKKSTDDESEFDFEEFEKELHKEKRFIRKLRPTSVNFPNFRPIQIMNKFPKNNVEEKEIITNKQLSIDWNETLKENLMDINEKLKTLRGVSILSSVKLMENDESEVIPEVRRVKRHKNESKARKKREERKESSSSSKFSDDVLIEEKPSHQMASRKELSEPLPKSPPSSQRKSDYLSDQSLLPEPIHPIMDKLDLTQLSPPIEKREDRIWNEIQVYSGKMEVHSSEGVPGLLFNSSPTNSSIKEQLLMKQKVEYPEWLKLLPPKDDDSGRPSTSTARLLDLELALKSNRSVKAIKKGLETIRTHDTKSPDFSHQISSSKMMEPKSFIGFSCSMTEAQINDLMGLCN